MATFAVLLRNGRSSRQEILMLIDERRDADEIAYELRRKGRDVIVGEVHANEEAGPPRLAFGP